MAPKVDATRQPTWAYIVDGKEEAWRDNMGSNAISKSKLRYMPPMEKDGKPIVPLKSGNFFNVKKNFENLVIGGFVGRRPPFLFVKEAVQKVWQLKIGFIMKPYGERCFLFEFIFVEDREKVLETGTFIL